VIRFFFDAGSGTCFWSANDASRERFGYFIDPHNLPLDIATMQEVIELINAYDNAFDWDDPGGSHERDGSLQELIEDSGDAVLRHVREKLGSDYDVVDERR
jgi:hypothetical protein